MFRLFFFQTDLLLLEQGVLVCVAYDFGGMGGCKESREVIIKAWTCFDDEEYRTESSAYSILTALPMKGCPSFIESHKDPTREVVFAMVLEKLGPSLEELCNLMSPVRFNEKMTLALAIQMVRVSFSLLI